MTQSFFQTFILLLLVTDPFGNVPLFVTALKEVDPARRPRIVLRECAIAFLLLLVFMFFGRHFLEALHLTDISLRIGGAVILLIIAIRMIFPHPDGVLGRSEGGEPFIVPLAIPLVAGPSGMAAVMLMGSREPDRLGEWSLALFLAWAATAAILLASPFLYRLLGRRALTAVERLMGMLLVAISVQMLLDGLSVYLGHVPAA